MYLWASLSANSGGLQLLLQFLSGVVSISEQGDKSSWAPVCCASHTICSLCVCASGISVTWVWGLKVKHCKRTHTFLRGHAYIFSAWALSRFPTTWMEGEAYQISQGFSFLTVHSRTSALTFISAEFLLLKWHKSGQQRQQVLKKREGWGNLVRWLWDFWNVTTECRGCEAKSKRSTEHTRKEFEKSNTHTKTCVTIYRSEQLASGS